MERVRRTESPLVTLNSRPLEKRAITRASGLALALQSERPMTTTHYNPRAEFRKPKSRFFPIHAWATAGESGTKSRVTPTNMNASSFPWPTSDEARGRKWAATYVAKNVISRHKSGRHKCSRHSLPPRMPCHSVIFGWHAQGLPQGVVCGESRNAATTPFEDLGVPPRSRTSSCDKALAASGSDRIALGALPGVAKKLLRTPRPPTFSRGGLGRLAVSAEL
jgi:hypothetical protein